MPTDDLQIWYSLVQQDGAPFRGARPFKLTLSQTADIADLCIAVKEDNLNKLGDVDESDLKVFKSKADLCGQPVDVEIKISAIGTNDRGNIAGQSKANSLFVLVPSPVDRGLLINPTASVEQSLSQLTLAQASFKVKLDHDPLGAQQNGDWLIYEGKILDTEHDKIYIRPCYAEIANTILTRRVGKNLCKHAILTGTPGIGKSMFMFYLLRRLVENNQRVLFVYGSKKIYYDGRGGVFDVQFLPFWNNKELWSPDVWCLLDCKNVARIRSRYMQCSLIVATSPLRDVVNDFKKETPVPIWLYMPVWSDAEMTFLASVVYPTVSWRERANILGFIPRHVLEWAHIDARQIIMSAIRMCDFDSCVRAIGGFQSANGRSDVAHRLIHMSSVSPYTDYSATFASTMVRDEMVLAYGLLHKHKLQSLLQTMSGDSSFASLCGYVFEPYAMDQLQGGGRFKCRKLVHGKAKEKPAEFEIEIKPSAHREVVDRVDASQVVDQLYVPSRANFPAIDAWIPGFGGFQMTVGKTHDIKETAVNDLALLGKGAAKLYFVLPPLYYPTFTKKNPQTIEQYAICIPYPEL